MAKRRRKRAHANATPSDALDHAINVHRKRIKLPAHTASYWILRDIVDNNV